MNLKNIKLIVSEVDGVMTNGGITKDELCNTVFKSFNFKDFEAINEIKRNFIFCFLSADNSISYNLCRKKNIPFYWAQRSKVNVLYKILHRYSVTPTELFYVGSTFSDVDCMKLSEFSVCPYDAPEVIKNNSSGVLSSFSGEGVITEIYEKFLKNK